MSLAYAVAIGAIVVLVLGLLYATLVRSNTAGSGKPIANDPASLSLTVNDVGSGYAVNDSRSGRDEGLWFLQNYPTDGLLGGYGVTFNKPPLTGWVSGSIFKYDDAARATTGYESLRRKFAAGDWVGVRGSDLVDHSGPLNIQSFGSSSEGYQSVDPKAPASSILWRRCNVVAVVDVANKPERVEDLARIVDTRIARACGN